MCLVGVAAYDGQFGQQHLRVAAQGFHGVLDTNKACCAFGCEARVATELVGEVPVRSIRTHERGPKWSASGQRSVAPATP